MATRITERIWNIKVDFVVQMPAVYKLKAMLNKSFGSSMFI